MSINFSGSELINLTPHDIAIFDKNDEVLFVLKPSGLARVSTEREQMFKVNNIPVNKIKYTTVEGLPDPQENTYYIVSEIVANSIAKSPIIVRNDLLCPDTDVGSAVRDDEGQILGSRGFQFVTEETF